MAPSRRRARSSEPAADLLTSLPPLLLDSILTRLDLRDAVRTSALSRAWRRRWVDLPCLSLSRIGRGGIPAVAVDSVLLRYPGNISNFSIHSLDTHSARRVDDWLIAVRNRGVKSIDLKGPAPAFALHSSVFLCTSLVCLKLHLCLIPPLPVEFTGFPVLKQLELSGVTFPPNGQIQLEAIIKASPLLDTLSLIYVDTYSEAFPGWVIWGANLRRLTIVSKDNHGWQVAELPNLHEATINLQSCENFSDFGGLLAGLAQVRKLVLNKCYPPFTEGHILETLPCTFDNLKSLTLWTHFEETPTILSTFCLLRNAPNLEELDIVIEGFLDEEEADGEFQNAQWTDGMCPNLQVVRLKGVLCSSNEMCFIQLLLSKATVLRTMSINLGYGSLKSSEDALRELITYRRASPHAQIFFDGKEP
ncbi:F-box/FBD/LRR-repeat protein At1g13570-like isoform X2 [Triticum dicoccoides]|nr:F-box/FBD/LRR-repeat protein At1g13570-like isoform X2 [Triticum dicoccoides]XP_044388762.1 F-box/FBD/LRR-repeat protein At1g13570-like isoform X1 [Triticum aestivum]